MSVRQWVPTTFGHCEAPLHCFTKFAILFYFFKMLQPEQNRHHLMLINARDPRQWTYLRNLPPKKKKKNPGINQCGEKGGGGGYYIPSGSVEKLENQQNQKEPPVWVGEKTSKNRRVPDIKPQRYMITMNINIDTRIDPQPALLQFLIPGPVPYKIPVRDRLTSERWSKLYRGRLSGPVLPQKICLSVRPSDCPGRFCRRIKTQNRRVRQTHARTD